MKCARGQIERNGYQRKAYVRNGKKIKATYVEPACIKDIGVPGKGTAPTVPPLRNGKLPQISYNVQEPARFRQEAIARGVERYGKEMLQWRLQWEGTWRSKAKGEQLDWSKRLLRDAKWLEASQDLPVINQQCPGRKRKAFSFVRDGKTVHVPAVCLKWK